MLLPSSKPSNKLQVNSVVDIEFIRTRVKNKGGDVYKFEWRKLFQNQLKFRSSPVDMVRLVVNRRLARLNRASRRWPEITGQMNTFPRW